LAEIEELKVTNMALANGMEILQENVADVVLALDNQGWNPLGEELDLSEIPLYTIKRTSRTARALGIINPLIKRGVDIRTAYIWGGGVEFTGLPDKTADAFVKSANSQKYLLSPKACAEMEMCLATDGNYFLLVSKGGTFYSAKKSVQRLPLFQITGTVSSPDNHEEVWFYRREWVRVVNNEATDAVAEQLFIEYVPAIDYDVSNGRPRQMRGYPVNYGSVIAHHAVNKQVGWKWGVPDMMSVIFWAKAHKEFLENQAALVKAYSRFAWKVAAPSRNGVQTAATKVGTAPGRDPITGEPNDIGGAFIGGMGATLSSVGRTGGSVDFKAGLPLAGYVAAGLNVPLNELTADGGDANRSSAETLSASNEKVMKARQDEHKAFFEAIFDYLGYTVTVKFPPITLEAVYRQIQSVVQAAGLNLLSDDEVRTLLLKAFDIETDDGVPTEEQMKNLLLSITLAGEQQKEQKAAQQQQATQTAIGGSAAKPETGNPSYGDNSYRSDAGQHAYTGGKNG
jgi:hypothetical protein